MTAFTAFGNPRLAKSGTNAARGCLQLLAEPEEQGLGIGV